MKNKISKLVIVTFLILFLKPDRMLAQMFWNQACLFSGTASSYIAVRPTASNDITQSFTVEAWLKAGNVAGSYKGIVAKGGLYGAQLKYGVRIRPGGRVEIFTKSALRLVSKTSLPVNYWTHVAAVFDLSLNKFSIYFNGNIDTSAVATGDVRPTSIPDSLFIGIAGQTNPFNGIMDELRIWNRPVDNVELKRNMRLTLGTSSGSYYSGLILSMTFQKDASAGVKFTCNDWSNHQNYGTYYAVTPVDLSDQTSQTIAINQSVYLSTGDEYLAGADDPDISPSNAITLQAWIYPLSENDAVIIHKGPPTSDAATNYRLSISNKKLSALINGNFFDSQDTIPILKWSHVAFTYSYSGSFFIGSYAFYVNGKKVKNGSSFGIANITDGTDSLYIGGTIGLPDFRGYIDEVRISAHAKTEAAINDSLYVSMENASNLPGVTIAYNFDGYTYCSSLRGPHLYFRNAGLFTSPNSSYPVSPLNKGFTLTSFQKGYYMKTTDRRIPAAGDIGNMTEDSLEIFADENITDVNLFVALNHGNTQELELYLRAPDGTTLQVLNSNTLLQHADNIITVFDDQSINSLYDGLYATYSPTIKPLYSMNAFNGINAKGIWKILINDYTGTGTGRLYSWGLQINNKTILPKILKINALIQGFYNPSANNLIRDTLKAYLRNSFSPYLLIDSSKVYLQTDGSGILTFTNSAILRAAKYYLQIKHRNSIETWSNTTGIIFEPLTSQSTYNFTSDSTKAFGNNLIQVDNSPVRFAIYSGDVNQDGLIDLTDASLIDNALFNFISGYVVTDLTGDNAVDLSDAAIADNNAFNFVSVERP
ncbi:MAG: LamG-like jellyroll fold domain-containing protein [bacterium]